MVIVCTIAVFSCWNFKVIRNAEGQRNIHHTAPVDPNWR
jgi:hypothetical protein